MGILDNLSTINKFDSLNMLGSLELLGKQIEQIAAQAKGIKTPQAYKSARNIVVAGMGGSSLGAHIIKSVFHDDLKIPTEVVNGYCIPGYVDSKTLVLVSSYSGNTEEAVAALREAKQKQAKIAIITSGGVLEEFARKNKIPALIFTTENNPCHSPRMGLGYSIFGQIILLSKLGFLKISSAQIIKAAKTVEKYAEKFGFNSFEIDNPAKQMAVNLGERSVWYAASEHLSGNAHAAANQINENAKRFAGYFLIPELNHHLMEGMMNPKSNQKELAFVFLESDLYDSRVQKRYEITKKVLEKNHIYHLSYGCVESDALSQACEALVFCSYVSFYLAMLEGIDPTAIPFVDFFKNELKK